MLTLNAGTNEVRKFDVCNGRFDREGGVISFRIYDKPTGDLEVTEVTPTGLRKVESVVDASDCGSVLACRLEGITPAYGVRTLRVMSGKGRTPYSSDLTWIETTNAIVVGTKWFELSHPKRGRGGIPRDIRFRTSGFCDRELTLLDRVYRPHDGCFQIVDDAEAVARVAFASPLRVVVEVKTSFRQGKRSTPDSISAIYRYAYTSGSPVVEVSRQVWRNGANALDWNELHFLQLSRRSRYYDSFFIGPNNCIRRLDAPGGKGGLCGGRQWGLMSSEREAAGVGGGWTDCWDAAREYVYYVRRNMIPFPATKVSCCQRGLLYFGPSDASERWLETWLGENREMRIVPHSERPNRSIEILPEKMKLGLVSLVGGDSRLSFASAAKGFAVAGLKSPSGESFFRGSNGDGGLWRMIFKDGIGGKSVTVDARQGDQAECQRRENSLRFSWRNLAIDDERGVLDVDCDVKWNAEETQYEFGISARNRSHRFGLFSTTYPLLNHPLAEGSGRACLPGGNWGLQTVKDRTISLDAVYPSVAAPMQFMAFEQDGDVAYLAAHDPDSQEKVLHATAYDEVFIETIAENAGVAGQCAVPRYPVVLSAMRGNWWRAAKHYRRWATTRAEWMQKGPIGQRSDYPRRLADNAFWLRFSGDPEKVESEVAAAEKLIAGRIPFGFHWYCWHQIPFDNSYPEYFPAKLGFADAVRRMTSRGIMVMPYINARLWDSEISSFQSAVPGCAKNAGGGWCIEDYGSHRKLCAMCPTSPIWQRKVSEICRRLVDEAGVNAVYLDQIASARPARCYDAAHGHSLGGGHHWTTGYRALLAPIHDSTSARGVALTAENTAEPYLDNIDAFLTWSPNRETDLPALPAVYSGYTTYFACLESERDDFAAFRALHLRNFLWGCQLGWNQQWMLDAKHRKHFEFAIHLAELRHSVRDFLATGELMYEIRSEAANPPFAVTWHQDDGAHDVTMRSVQATLWRNAKGEQLLAAANLSREIHSFKAKLSDGRKLEFQLAPGAVRLERLGTGLQIVKGKQPE